MNIDRRVNQMRFAGISLAFLIGCLFGGLNEQTVVPAKDISQLKDQSRPDETLAQKVQRIHMETRSFGDFK